MKKFLSLVLVLSLVLAMGVGVFADVPTVPDPDVASITISKDIILENNGTLSPGETYNFTITPLDGAPEFTTPGFNIEVGEGIPRVISDEIALPDYTNTGIYTYEIKETRGTTAGMIYDGRTLILTVYVFDVDGELVRNVTIHDKDAVDAMVKDDGFDNTFEAGNLEIKKVVTGNMGERERYFDITVTLTKPDGTDIDSVTVVYNGGTYDEDVPVEFDSNGDAILNLQIKDGDTITIENLPYGVTWTVEETDYSGEGYTTTIDLEDGTIGDASLLVTITNHKEQNVNTGINLDNLPYILILIAAVGGLVGFTMKRRLSSDK